MAADEAAPGAAHQTPVDDPAAPPPDPVLDELERWLAVLQERAATLS